MDSVEEIKRRLDVDEVVGSYIQLKPAGRNFKALCPFHHEKTPSFMVSNEKGIWHCFGCNEGGDIFSFVMKMEGLDFRGVLENLARRAGVTLEPRAGSRSTAKLKERLLKINEAAAKFYQATLTKSVPATAYLKKRRFSAKTVKDWRFGYAPAGGLALTKWLGSHGAKDEEIIKAGLGRQAKTGVVDTFKNRLMIPLADWQGQVVGFTARVLDNSLPKYINTPQTILYDKSQLLFGLHLAKEAIRQADETVVVEGNLDVISSHQAGINNVVASSGTALTLAQLKALSRLSKKVKLAFDQDEAGIAATERSIPLAQSVGASLYIVVMPAVKDPDELIQKDPKLWSAAIKKAPYLMDWLLKVLPQQYSLTTATGKKQLTDRLMGVLAKLSDPVEQDHYVQAVAKLVKVDTQAIRRKLATGVTEQQVKTKSAAYQTQPLSDEGVMVEEALLALAATYPDTRISLQDVDEQHFTSQSRQQLYNWLKKGSGQKLTNHLPKQLHEVSDYVKVALLRGEEGYQDWASLDRRIEAFSLAARLHNLKLKKIRQQINQELKAAEAAGDSKRKTELLKQFRDLVAKG
ncbi:DNA primase [Candidatus Microgenomates bacterium]|nr:DNA primase [Candidatus Microgenomates bacterium]